MKINFGEFTPDVSNAEGGNLVHAYNVIPLADGSYNSFPTWATFSTSGALTGACLGAFSAQNVEETEDWAGDATKLYRITESGTTIAAVTRLSGVYSTPADTYWDFTQYGDYVIACNGGVAAADAPQVYYMDPATTEFIDLGGTPPFAATCCTIRDFLVFGNTYDATDGVRTGRVRWSAFGDHTSWTVNPATQADLQDLKTSSGPVRKLLGGHNGFVVCDKSTYLMTYEGPPTVFRFDEIAPGIGTGHPRSPVRYGDTIFFYTHGGFCAMGSDGQPHWIGKNKVDLTVRAALESKASSASSNSPFLSMVGFVSPRDQGVGWLYGNVIGSTTAGDYEGIGVFYSVATGRWTEFDLIDAVYPYTSKIDPSAGEGLYFYDLTSKVLYGPNTAGASLSWRLDTGDIQLIPDSRALITKVRPIYSQTQTTATPVLQIATRDDFVKVGDVTFSGAETWNTNGWWDVLAEGRYHRFQISDTDTGIQKLRGLEIESIHPSGRL